jgi:catechol 2,3-dioxygenase-like lactoylglutathione lyase family enzyme
MLDHLALQVADVDEVHAARAIGTEILHEPRLWPEYYPGYYGVFVRDPDGNNVEAVHHTFSG